MLAQLLNMMKEENDTNKENKTSNLEETKEGESASTDKPSYKDRR